MLKRLFPATITNSYQGSWIAVWLLVPVLLMKTAIGFNFSGLNPFVSIANILQTADGVPMDQFSPYVAQKILTFANAWGIAIFVLCLSVWLALLRYRAAIPVAILLLLIEQIGRAGDGTLKLISQAMTQTLPSAPGAYINFGMTVFLGMAFLLSLKAVRSPTETQRTAH